MAALPVPASSKMTGCDPSSSKSRWARKEANKRPALHERRGRVAEAWSQVCHLIAPSGGMHPEVVQFDRRVADPRLRNTVAEYTSRWTRRSENIRGEMGSPTFEA
jgi:hypothetical protein